MSSYASQTTGTLFSAYGALAQGKQTSDLLDNQAQLQRRNATQALAAAKFNADRESMIATKHLGAMSAQYSAAGVDLSSGSVMAVLGASAANAELDRQNIIHGGDMRAVNYENQASLDELGAKHALQASYFNAMAGIVAGGAGAMNQNMGGGGQTPLGAEESGMGGGQSMTTVGGDEAAADAAAIA